MKLRNNAWSLIISCPILSRGPRSCLLSRYNLLAAVDSPPWRFGPGSKFKPADYCLLCIKFCPHLISMLYRRLSQALDYWFDSLLSHPLDFFLFHNANSLPRCFPLPSSRYRIEIFSGKLLNIQRSNCSSCQSGTHLCKVGDLLFGINSDMS